MCFLWGTNWILYTVSTSYQKWIPIICCKVAAQVFSAHNKVTFWNNSQNPTFCQTYLYQKDERALPGNLQNQKEKFFLPLLKYSVSHYTSPPFFSSPSLMFLGPPTGHLDTSFSSVFKHMLWRTKLLGSCNLSVVKYSKHCNTKFRKLHLFPWERGDAYSAGSVRKS
jgi:hypothetical protein